MAFSSDVEGRFKLRIPLGTPFWAGEHSLMAQTAGPFSNFELP